MRKTNNFLLAAIAYNVVRTGDFDVYMETWTDSIAPYLDDVKEGRVISWACPAPAWWMTGCALWASFPWTRRSACAPGAWTLKEALITDMPATIADTQISELFPVAAESKFPIAVLDGKQRLAGIISKAAILTSLQ